jgi:hypothetical protein
MTTLTNAFTINGIIDTKNKVLDNLNKICDAAGSFLTYDVNTGLWSIIINEPDTSVKSFDNSNIIGAINIHGTGLTEAYNGVSVEFPHKDMRDRTDFIDLTIPTGDRFANEIDNVLNINYDLVNHPVQAQYLATVELKQSRVDRVIDFVTDYTALGVKAGNVISVTNDQYGFTNKLFRVTRIEEIDTDAGGIELGITALEYDADVYDSSGLIYQERSIVTGIPAKINNEATKQADDQSTGETLFKLLGLNLVTGLLNSAISKNPITGKVTQTITTTSASRDETLSKIKKPGVVISGVSSICEGSTLTLSLSLDCSSCLYDPISYEYTITGVDSSDTTFPLTGTVNVPGSLVIPIAEDADTGPDTMVVTVGAATKSITINDKLAFTYVTTASPTSITEGASSTVTLTTTGVADGTTVPYTITGTGTGRVSTALTGNVTVNSNTATLTVNTTDDSTYTGTQTVTVTFNSAQADPCSQLDKTAIISILDNDPAPVVCPTVSIPIVWCATYSGSTGNVTGLTPAAYATVAAAYSGGPSTTVPLTVSVSSGNPSTVTVLTTATIDASANKGGQDFNVITTFNSIAPNAVPTGTTATVRGY